MASEEGNNNPYQTADEVNTRVGGTCRAGDPGEPGELQFQDRSFRTAVLGPSFYLTAPRSEMGYTSTGTS